ncbi:cytosolic carboxypeptidase 6 [Grus japonensis]|uniref:Cytosolic carboxypeptidase 6 n=1 Tax=Grus japonensis TaxID=30415 RepID=A0ABC9X647_GRUJA
MAGGEGGRGTPLAVTCVAMATPRQRLAPSGGVGGWGDDNKYGGEEQDGRDGKEDLINFSKEGFGVGQSSAIGSDDIIAGNVSKYTVLPAGYCGQPKKGHLIFDACFESDKDYKASGNLQPIFLDALLSEDI